MTRKLKTSAELSASNRARQARFAQAHPDYSRSYQGKRTRAARTLRERHSAEYASLMVAFRAEGKGYREAGAELARRHRDEWLDILASA